MPATPSRRNLLRAGVWAAPAVVLASAAPAYAASGATTPPVPSPGCREAVYSFAWSGSGYSFSRTSPGSARETGTGTARAVVTTAGLTQAEIRDEVPLMVVASNALMGSRVQGKALYDQTVGRDVTNMRVSPYNVGNLNKPGLTLLQDFTNNAALGANAVARRAHAQELTLQFSRPVKNLRFTITDIDSTSGWWTGQYQDRVAVSGAPTISRPNTLRGSGTFDDPIRNTGTNNSYDPKSSGAGNASVQYRADVSMDTVKITFWNDQSGSLAATGLQGIFISDLSFTASIC